MLAVGSDVLWGQFVASDNYLWVNILRLTQHFLVTIVSLRPGSIVDFQGYVDYRMTKN